MEAQVVLGKHSLCLGQSPGTKGSRKSLCLKDVSFLLAISLFVGFLGKFQARNFLGCFAVSSVFCQRFCGFGTVFLDKSETVKERKDRAQAQGSGVDPVQCKGGLKQGPFCL